MSARARRCAGFRRRTLPSAPSAHASAFGSWPRGRSWRATPAPCAHRPARWQSRHRRRAPPPRRSTAVQQASAMSFPPGVDGGDRCAGARIAQQRAITRPGLPFTAEIAFQNNGFRGGHGRSFVRSESGRRAWRRPRLAIRPALPRWCGGADQAATDAQTVPNSPRRTRRQPVAANRRWRPRRRRGLPSDCGDLVQPFDAQFGMPRLARGDVAEDLGQRLRRTPGSVRSSARRWPGPCSTFITTASAQPVIG